MTRVLFWNIEQFSINKIFSASTQVTPGHGGLTDQVAAAQRQWPLASRAYKSKPLTPLGGMCGMPRREDISFHFAWMAEASVLNRAIMPALWRLRFHT